MTKAKKSNPVHIENKKTGKYFVINKSAGVWVARSDDSNPSDTKSFNTLSEAKAYARKKIGIYDPMFLDYCKSYDEEVKEYENLIESKPDDVKLLKQEYKKLTGKQYKAKPEKKTKAKVEKKTKTKERHLKLVEPEIEIELPKWKRYTSIREDFAYLDENKHPFRNVKIYLDGNFYTVSVGDGYKVDHEKTFETDDEAIKYAESEFKKMMIKKPNPKYLTEDKIEELTSTSSLDVDKFLETALWATTGLDDDEGLDSKYRVSDVSPKFRKLCEKTLKKFEDTAWEYLTQEEIDDDKIEHNIWLTMHGHGAGFWDGDYEEGDKLTEACEKLDDLEDKLRDDLEE